MQDSQAYIEQAQNYVLASNAHDIAAIGPMLAEGCRYVSTGVGEHRGKAAILSMMEGFFSNNPDVRWDVPDYRLDGSGCVVFDFTISLGGQSSSGLEKISFNNGGEICLIEVSR